jgi:peptide/nickel transport system substrate-binding protein
MNHSSHIRRVLFSIALLAALFAFGGFTLAQEENVLVIGHAESTDSLDPARGYTQTTGIIAKATYETLVTFPADSAAEILPQLATEWAVSEDGLNYTFTLREGAVFASGNPVTPEDVVFSIERLMNLDGSPSFLADGIAGLEAGEGTVTITLSTPNPAFLSQLAGNPFSITDSVLITENGGTTDPATDAGEEFLNSTSAGSGPYVLESWEREVQTTLVRNPNYQGDAPYFDRVIIQNIPEPATQKTALEAGDIDIALDLAADQIAEFEGNADIAVARTPGNIHHFLLMNADPEIGGIVSDPLVQKAIRLALDYEGYKARSPALTSLWVCSARLAKIRPSPAILTPLAPCWPRLVIPTASKSPSAIPTSPSRVST